jgi:CRISPR-associated protein Csb1
MSDLLEKYDYLLKDDGPAAIIIKQWLKPVGDEIIFPPTYANASQKKGDPPVYNVDRFQKDGKDCSVCVIDSIPSQANRIEPAFASIAGGKLVPQIRVEATIEKEKVFVNLLDAGHRAADAVVRFSPLADELKKAIKDRDKGDSISLAKLAPTSLIFGMWDSRDTGVKVPRLINSIIRAHDVQQFRRSAQYFPAMDFEAAGVGKEEELNKASTEGMAEVPATFALGGIQAFGGICRDTSLNLCTLRDISTASDEQAVKLRRYILGLSLVAITYFDGKTMNLRQGCQLVGIADKPMSRKLINADGTEMDFSVTREDAVEYAEKTAAAFGVTTTPRDVTFNPTAAKNALKKKDKKSGETASPEVPK